MKTHTIEGHWSGPRSPAGDYTRVVHREHTRSQKRIEDIKKLGMIFYTDGTCLFLHVKEGKQGKAINGYGSLIDQCIAAGTNQVSDLP